MKVKCINNGGGYQDLLTIGKVYEVHQHSDQQCYALAGDQGQQVGARKSRFETVEDTTPAKVQWVKCIKSTSQGTLEKGKVYQVGRETDEHYFLLGLPGQYKGPWRKDRFQVVSGPFDQSKVADTIPAPKNKGSVDLDEEKIWAKWVQPHAGECKCGILKSQCRYHA